MSNSPVSATTSRMVSALGWIALVVLLFLAPLFLSGYRTFQLTGVITYAIAALGLNLITGYVGQVSLGHNMFFALGAYAAILTNTLLGVSPPLSVFIAALVCFGIGYLAGFPAKRLRGLYLALITLILAVSVVPLVKYFKSYTGGAAGLTFDKPVPPAWFTLGQDTWLYDFVLVFAIVIFWAVRNFVAGSTGRALAGIRENELAASSMGVDVNHLKVIVFGTGSMLGGIGGALSAYSIGFIGPDSFTLMLSIGFLASIVVGGLGTISGAVVAGLFLQFVPSYASDISQALAGAVYGGILILCMFLMPRGITGSLIKLFNARREAGKHPSNKGA